MERYAARKDADLLFVHTDKHVYTNNEFIWFSAYLLHCSEDSLPMHRFLSLALVQAGTRACTVQQKFVMQNGHSAGSFQLPDSIAPGEYQLLATTNLTGADSLPMALFTQPLLVRSLHQPDFGAYLNTVDDSLGNKEVEITVREKTSGMAIRDAELQVSLGGEKEIRARTNKLGSFRQQIPASAINDTSGLIINARVKYNGDLVFLQKTLPPAKIRRRLKLRFFPEGGELVAGIPVRVGWETVTDQGEPLAVKAVLFRNNEAIDTLLTNEQGLGSFLLLPEKGVVYAMAPLQLPAEVLQPDKPLSLPAVRNQGMSLSVPRAVVHDTLQLRLYAAGLSQVKLVVHNFNAVYVTEVIPTKPGGRDVVLLLNDIPRGLAAITLLDSLDRPLAERIFFAHYDRKVQVQTLLDRKTYGKREKVTLTLQLTASPAFSAGLASLSCAQANRFETRKQQDIETAAFLQSVLEEGPAYTKGRLFEDQEHLELLLLVRGWRRYSWKEMAADTAPAPSHFYSYPLRGQVVNIIRRIRKPVTLSIIGSDAPLQLITTDSSGRFEIPYDRIVLPQDKKMWLAAFGSTAENYVDLFDPYAGINRKAASRLNFTLIDANRFSQSSQELILKDFSPKNLLAAVTVRARKDDIVYGTANRCGDYICQYNILNCPNHPGSPGSRAPVKGQTYGSPGGVQVVYWGCTLEENHKEALRLLDGIRIGKEFYGEDFSNKTDSLPESISTLYWSPAITFSADGKAGCSFYTSDITGLFRIVVNGLTNDNLFYASEVFEVR